MPINPVTRELITQIRHGNVVCTVADDLSQNCYTVKLWKNPGRYSVFEADVNVANNMYRMLSEDLESVRVIDVRFEPSVRNKHHYKPKNLKR